MKNLFSLLTACILSCALLISCSNPGSDAQNKQLEKNKVAMQKILESFSTGNVDNLGNYIADDCVEHTPDPNISATGLEGVKQMIAMYRSSFPDMKVNIMSMTAEGDMVITHYNMTGTNSGPMGEMPPTGKSMNVNGVDVVKFKDGKATEHWGYWEESKFMEQLGLMGAPEVPQTMEEQK
ncbi:MAG: ester cyclase [Bacteroidetes bacterium]|nr:MAG: ester cyclase [Bacteroidota bacterium]REK04718.1 MAG: ester cyclase [Bacteroidota bacterium]REK36192.1 MAG: ester cyclase [Bacteroidota bacterium]REK51437.1 MAG: ester cyclase [Bacteroidota bacterium]